MISRTLGGIGRSYRQAGVGREMSGRRHRSHHRGDDDHANPRTLGQTLGNNPGPGLLEADIFPAQTHLRADCPPTVRWQQGNYGYAI